MATADELNAAGAKATWPWNNVIETFAGDWEKEWFTYEPGHWGRRTNKIYDRRWQGPDGARLALDVLVEHPNSLGIEIDGFVAKVQLTGGTEWQTIMLSPGDFKNSKNVGLRSWFGLRELHLNAADALGLKRNSESRWQGTAPKFRNLRWLHSKIEN